MELDEKTKFNFTNSLRITSQQYLKPAAVGARSVINKVYYKINNMLDILEQGEIVAIQLKNRLVEKYNCVYRGYNASLVDGSDLTKGKAMVELTFWFHIARREVKYNISYTYEYKFNIRSENRDFLKSLEIEFVSINSSDKRRKNN